MREKKRGREGEHILSMLSPQHQAHTWRCPKGGEQRVTASWESSEDYFVASSSVLVIKCEAFHALSTHSALNLDSIPHSMVCLEMFCLNWVLNSQTQAILLSHLPKRLGPPTYHDSQATALLFNRNFIMNLISGTTSSFNLPWRIFLFSFFLCSARNQTWNSHSLDSCSLANLHSQVILCQRKTSNRPVQRTLIGRKCSVSAAWFGKDFKQALKASHSLALRLDIGWKDQADYHKCREMNNQTAHSSSLERLQCLRQKGVSQSGSVGLAHGSY